MQDEVVMETVFEVDLKNSLNNLSCFINCLNLTCMLAGPFATEHLLERISTSCVCLGGLSHCSYC